MATTTKRDSLAASSLVLALLLLGTVVYASPVSAASGSNGTSTTSGNDCTTQTDPFSVTGASWGTAASPASPYPGDQNVPLTITFLFSGPCTSPQTTIYLGFTQGPNPVPFTGPNGEAEPKDVAVDTTPNTILTETYEVSIDQNATTGATYYIPLIIEYTNNTASSVLTQTAQPNGGALVAPISLYGTVQLNFAADVTHLAGGTDNNVTVTISNSGSGPSGPVSTTVTAPSGVTLLDQLATTAPLAPGASTKQTLQLFVPTSMSGTAFDLTFAAKYVDAYSNGQTTTQTLGFTVTTSMVATSSSFLVEGAAWGSSASATAPLPGTQDTPLVVSLQYLGQSPVTSLEGSVALPPGITDVNGRGTAVAYSASTTNQYGVVQLTFYLDISSSTRSGSGNFTLNLDWMTSQSSGLSQTAVITPPPLGALESSFQVQSATWGSASASSTNKSATAPAPGTSDASLIVSLAYLGTVSATDVEASLKLPAGMTNLNGQQTATAYAATAAANQVITLTFDLDVGSGVTPGSYSFGLALSWMTPISVPFDQNGTVTPPPIASATTSASFPLSVAQANSTITDGAETTASFTLTNEGAATIYSPTFSLSVASPVVLASIGSPVPSSQLAPGKSVAFSATLTSGPSATPGIYSGTLTVSFADTNGASHTQTFPVSFTVKGTVVLILQDTSVSQSATGFTITGSILNEGSASGYYASIGGALSGSAATPVYLGEIDPNTPLPFSVTIPFTAPATTTAGSGTGGTTSSTTASFTRTGSRSFTGGGFPGGAGNFTRGFIGNGTFPGAGFPGVVNGTFVGANGTRGLGATSGAATIELTLTYKDTFGDNQQQAFPVTTTVRSASQLAGNGITSISASSSTNGELIDVAYAVIAVVVATIVVGALFLRRYRAERLASLPQEQKGEQSVI